MRSQLKQQQQQHQFGMQQYVPPTEAQQYMNKTKSREQSQSQSQLQNKQLYHAQLRKTIVHKSSSNLHSSFNSTSKHGNEKRPFGSFLKDQGDQRNSLLEQFMHNQGQNLSKTSTKNLYHYKKKSFQSQSQDLLENLKINNQPQTGHSNIHGNKKKIQLLGLGSANVKKKQQGLRPLKQKNMEKDFMNPVFANEDDKFQAEEKKYEKDSSRKLNSFNKKDQQENHIPIIGDEMSGKITKKSLGDKNKLPKLGSEQLKNKQKQRFSNNNENSNILKNLNNTGGNSIDYNAYKQEIQKNSFMNNFNRKEIKSQKEFQDNKLLDDSMKKDDGSFVKENNNNKRKLSGANSATDLDKLKHKLNKKNIDLNYMGQNGGNYFENQSLGGFYSSNNQQKSSSYKGLYSSQNKRSINNDVQQKMRSFTPGQITKKPHDQVRGSRNSQTNIHSNNNNQEQHHQEDKRVNFINMIAQQSRAGANLQGTKTNQDSYIIKKNLLGRPNWYIFGVCDGHGQNGHLVSQFIKTTLVKKIELNLQSEMKDTIDDEFVQNSLNLSFLQTSQSLLESSIDCTFSGTTCAIVLILDDKIWSANLGDSRAVMARGTGLSGYKAVPLTFDHKVDAPNELERILKTGGRAEPYRDFEGNQVGPYRVWLQDEDLPGLAMARSFGDIIATQAGVICEPEILKYEVTAEDRYLIVCSDGVWEFIDDQQAVNFALPFYVKSQPEQACQKLVRESVMLWKKNDEVIDDITAVCVFFKKPGRQPNQSQKNLSQQNNFVNQNNNNN